MVKKIESELKESGVKYGGNLALSVLEESSDSDTDVNNLEQRINRKGIQTLTNLPINHQSAHSSSNIVIDTINALHSSDIHVGPTTNINGDVIIKQIIHLKQEVDNPAYTKTDPETRKEPCVKETKPSFGERLRTWHKAAFSAACVAILGGICACILLLKEKSQDTVVSSNAAANPNNVFISPNYLRIVQRDDWLAQPPNGKLDALRLPVPWVIIAHTAAGGCSIQSECVYRVRVVQQFHVESKKWADIGYNFLVGGDGSAYVGRGWDYVGAHTQGYNVHSIGISFIGTFTKEAPPKKQIEACLKLINLGVKLGKIQENYTIFAHRQLIPTESPGEELYKIMTTWPRLAVINDDTQLEDLLPKNRLGIV